MTADKVSWRNDDGDNNGQQEDDASGEKDARQAINDTVREQDENTPIPDSGEAASRDDPVKEGATLTEQDAGRESGVFEESARTMDSPDPEQQTLREQEFRKTIAQENGEALADSIFTEDGNYSKLTHLKYEEPESELEKLQLIEAFLDEIDKEFPLAQERKRAGDYYSVTDRFGEDTTTQDKLCFDYVRDDGIIVDGDTYYAMQRVIPTRWESKDEDQKMSIIRAYISYLKSLQWGIAIPCYPKGFDFSKYIYSIYEAEAESSTSGVHPILSFGRREHIGWTTENLDPEKVKKKEYYVVVPVNKKRMGSVLSGRGKTSLLQSAVRFIKDHVGSQEEAVEEACIQEIKERQNAMSKELSRTGVQVDEVTDRQTAMEMLYHYYNHVEPVLDEFDSETVPDTGLTGVGQ